MAVYNNGYPVGYPQYLPQYQQQTYQQPASNGGIIWVQGEAGAKSYLVAPNTTVQLWDSENKTIYLKSADASGMPSMRILDYTIRDAMQPTPPAVQEPAYATRTEVETLASQLSELRSKIDALAAKE